MKRFMGMMPSDEVTIEKSYKDEDGHNVMVQAGPNGWTILFADGGAMCRDIEANSEDNFNEAYTEAERNVGTLTLDDTVNMEEA